MLCDLYWWIDLLSIIPFYVELYIVNQQGCEPAVLVSSGSNASDAAPVLCNPAKIPAAVRAMQLLRLLRILKLMRHYVDMRVLILAITSAGRALLVPGFAMAMCILLLSGALWLAEGAPGTNPEDAFDDAFEALWCVFWIVSTMGYEGRFGSGGGWGKLILAAAVVCGLVLTTMPITFVGEAFSHAWNRRELLILEMRVQDELVKRGISVQQFKVLFDELDVDASGELDWNEFKAALERLGIRLPVQKMRALFEFLDEDRQGNVSYHELCKALFPRQDWEMISQMRSIGHVVVVQAHVRGFLVRMKKHQGTLRPEASNSASRRRRKNRGSLTADAGRRNRGSVTTGAAKLVKDALGVGAAAGNALFDSALPYGSARPTKEAVAATPAAVRYEYGGPKAMSNAPNSAPFDARRLQALENAVHKLTAIAERLEKESDRLAEERAQMRAVQFSAASGV